TSPTLAKSTTPGCCAGSTSSTTGDGSVANTNRCGTPSRDSHGESDCSQRPDGPGRSRSGSLILLQRVGSRPPTGQRYGHDYAGTALFLVVAPVAGAEVPHVAAMLERIRMPDVALAVRDELAVAPDVIISVPGVVSAFPEVARTGRRDDFVTIRRRRHADV